MESYRTLLVAPDTSERSIARHALEAAGESVVAEAASLSEMQIAFDQTRPEAVLLDAALLPLTQELRDLLHPAAIVIMRPAEPDADTLAAIVESAAFSTICKPFTPEAATAEIALAVMRNADLMDCSSELDKVQTRLTDRIVIEKAKGLLIQHESLTEPEAFKKIHFAARKANRTMRDVADEIVAQFAEGAGGA